MPGSIQVSVLGLMDLSSPPPLSSLSLTVTMGKREYQTVGVGELSLPVVSLRENLTVMVHDEEGEEILRTEFKTMLLLERGLWDNLFPLKNGGSLHMKLQFLLSEEDRKRIREMRNSALKRRHLEKPGIRHRRSFSDDRIGYSPTTIAEIGTEEMLLDHSESADLIVEPYFGQSGKFPASRIGMVGFPRNAVIRGEVSNLNFPQTMSKSFSVGMLSEISLPGKSKPVKEPFLLKETQNAIPAMHYETLGNKDLICDDEIHMLDIGTQEIRVTKNTISDAEPPYSAECANYMTFDNGHKTIGSGKSTSFGAGTSSEIKDLVSVNVDEVPSIIGIIRKFETVREVENINFMRRGGAGLASNAASGTFKARPLRQSSVELGPAGAQHSRAAKRYNTTDMAGDGNATSSKGVNRKINIVDAYKNNNEERNFRDKSLPLNKVFDDLGKIDPCQQGSLGEVARTVSDQNMQSPSNDQISSAEHGAAAKKYKSRNWPYHVDATSFKGVNRKTETVDINENGDEEQNLGDKYIPLKKMVDETKKIKHPYHQGTSVEVAKTVNDENTLQNPSNELPALGSSYEKAEASKSGYSSLCPIGILGTWTPRHICITTGSKLLREFAESCTISFETNPIESSSMSKADTKVCSSFS
ncbi:uncharacterized protein LOC110113099 isoform X1 [Dendrobium catenatum]|uniref:uncharacterized protein LOC110113099 isoform X1 n=2 Tax=Dendrobium catenatum TaxID=906689 RepID=UPI0010A030F6|nr:uncharacterized protein LOC110113099 isoform X1 [Dendrobium catenatum]